MKTVFYNGKLILWDRIEEGKYLAVENDRIVGIYNNMPEGDWECYDLRGNYLSPGFVDIHVHGGGGHDFNDATVEAFVGASREHMLHGTTSLMPTVVACSPEELEACVECYDSLGNNDTVLPHFLGLHLEGPYLSPEQSGAIDKSYILEPDREACLKLLNRTDAIRRMTVAPELPGALELGDELKSRGIMASIGHSNAEYAQVLEAVEHGYTHVTHLYSAMSMVHRKKAYRKLGVVESTYLLDGLTAEIITDGCHLPIELIELILRIKGTDKVCLITDAMRGAGMPNGTKTLLGSLKNGQEVYIQEDVAFMPDFSCFAGSTCTADRCIRTLHKNTAYPLWEIVKMMTWNPCKALGEEQDRGLLAAGYVADLVVFDEEITIKDVFVGGKKA